MCIPRIILPIFTLSAFLALPSVGNDTAFGGTAASPYPVHTKEIRMASEHITIRSEASSSSLLYTCDFVFENMSSAPITIMMGMPFFTMGDRGRCLNQEGRISGAFHSAWFSRPSHDVP